VDYAEWSPETDPLIPHPYSANDLAGKERNKKALLEAMGLPYRKGAPALGVVSRLTSQKGFDLLFDSLPELLGAADVRFVALGDGEPKYVEFFREVQRRYPRRAAFYHGYNNRLAHMIEAGADLFLMPSRYEPCGLNQMYSLRYGTPPVVRRTGGLADTVETFDPATGRGTGFVFDHFTPDGLRWALRHGLRTYGDPGAWRRLQKNAMAMNFSWENQGARYVDLYRRLAGVP
jgi:starch synthase